MDDLRALADASKPTFAPTDYRVSLYNNWFIGLNIASLGVSDSLFIKWQPIAGEVPASSTV